MTLLLTALLMAGNAMAEGEQTTTTGVRIGGSVYGGGNQADVKTNTEVNMGGGTVEGNVYGGGNLGDVGTHADQSPASVGNYDWKDQDGNNITTNTATDKMTGFSKVTITGGTIGVENPAKPKEHGNVFGGGKGAATTFECEQGMVYKTNVSINTTGSVVKGNVYGGGEVSRVENNTVVTIGTASETDEPTIEGSVFAAGAGLETHGYSALVRGTSTVTVQGKAKVWKNVYGGGELASVGRYKVKTPANANDSDVPKSLPYGMPAHLINGGTNTVVIQDNAVIGTNDIATTGHVYGAGQGLEPRLGYDYQTEEQYGAIEGNNAEDYDIDAHKPKRMNKVNGADTWEYFVSQAAYLQFVETLALSAETDVTITGSTTVKGSVFGGSESGFVYHDTDVKIQNGTINGSVFGGGRGLESFAEAGRVRGNTEVTMNNGSVAGNVYGGGNLGDVGTIYKDAKDEHNNLTYNYIWRNSDANGNVNDTDHNNTAGNNTITGTNKNTGICKVTISGGTIGSDGSADEDHGNVFGAGRGTDITWWCEKAIAYATNVSVSGGTVNGNIYGGGQVGRVEDDAKVTIGTSGETETDKPNIAGNVFGAGAGLETHGYSALVRGNADVTVQGTAQIGGSVYGGGEIASVGKFEVVGGLPTKPKAGGTCIVNIKDNAKIGESGTGHNVYGACKGVTPHYNSLSYKDVYSMQTYENRPSDTPGDTWDYWETYAEGYEGQKFIKRYYKREADYLAFLKTLALTSHPHVTIGGTWTPNETTGTITASGTPYVYGSVYGGGQRGVTLGNVDVNMVAGTVEQDVYGGGALADTNLGNWDVNGYVVATALNEGESITDLYERSGAGTAENPYKYTKITDSGTTFSSGTYYRQEATWAHTEGSAFYTTSVDLTGGTIKGDAYGGGLGQKTDFYDAQGVTAAKDIEAVVWGDINVTLGSNDGSSATSFYTTYDNAGTSETPVQVIKSGRVFGCNNLLGSPQGDVTVTVWRTVAGNGDNKKTTGEVKAANKAIMDAHPDDYESVSGYVTPTYEVAAVYGGGNLAPYEAAGKKAHVIINGCDLTSILTVYGGGNAAPVPETAVDVNSCYEIGSVFGGGNGKDKYKKGTTWTINPGANVNGNANTLIYGGTVHEAYGGSNEKGTVYGDVVIDIADSGLHEGDDGYCALDVAQLVGAGKNADVNGDLKIIMGCKPSEKIPLVFGGADNANVNGDVELTITSGNFGKIFGGNNNGGRIKGHIILNIEETTCIPLNIDHLYLCGNNAAYSQYGYYVMTEETEAENGDGIGDTNETPILSSVGKLYLIPRVSADDPHLPVNTYSYTYNEETETAGATWTVFSIPYAGYAAPVLNVTSCTSIGEVFGGGYGATATVYGNPTVNINMIPGDHAAEIDRDGVTDPDDTDGNLLGAIGDVYGGGDAAAVYGNTTVNIGTATSTSVYRFAQDQVTGEYKVQYDGDTPIQDTRTVTGAYITGNVYGGGKLADVGKYHEVADAEVAGRNNAVIDLTGNTNVNIGAKLNNSGNWESVTEGTAGIFIGGDVYGGGKGDDTSFFCDAAMVLGNEGTTESSNDANNDGGGTHVRIGNGTINGNVYGGGEIARVERNTEVTIGFGAGVAGTPTTNKPVIMGTVFGAGAGLRTHGYSALVRGHSSVTIEGNAKVMQSVYGGGEMATVGRYQVTNNIAEYNISGGKCTVTIGGYAEIGPNDMVMNNTTTHKPDDYGHVFGAGKGIQPYEGFADSEQPWSKIPNGEVKYKKFEALVGDEKLPNDYATYIRTLALATETDVTIKDHAFVKGCVFGGSENGFVQEDTHVTIQDDCQIGNGYVQMTDDGTYLDKLSTSLTPLAVNRRYTADEWSAGHLIMGANDRQALKDLVSPNNTPTYYTSSLPECASWPYGQAANVADRYAPYDPNYGTSGYDSNGGRTTADDGHTFYGSVFGGGSGYYPYKPGRWFVDAGAVYGNTRVDITGGHILTSVYGGNELTNVGKYQLDSDGKPTTIIQSGGKCTVNFGGTATLGVPRTLKQISAHPVTCYLFGAGKGDQRVLFNKSTNVGDVEVNITGGTIYGSVFGGGEDGHVMRDVKVTIDSRTETVPPAVEGEDPTTTTITPTIGTWGTSYVDGNVFGGGRGFSGEAYTAGNVAGSIKMEIKGGNILGSIYGGGRLGSVGYGLFESTNTNNYGIMQDDNKDDEGNTTTFYKDGPVGLGRGHIDITISGGTIGNNREYIIPNTTPSTGNAPSELDNTDFKAWTTEQWTAWKEHNSIPKTEFDTTTGQLTHTKGGNVFAGGMGNFYKQDGSTYINDVNWWKLGNANSTKVTITGGTIKSNVYGGGELGQVVGHHTTTNAAGESINASTEISISGSETQIGTEVKNGETTEYTFGSVFGSGYGSLIQSITVNGTTSYPRLVAGLVKEDTKIDMQGGEVKASIYGGGEMASVGESTTSGTTTTATGSTYVSVSGGTVGIAPIEVSGTTRYFGGAKMGNVYGGGSGHGNTVRSGKIFKNTNVNISGGTIYHNVYGGGAYGTVGDFEYIVDDDNKVTGVNKFATEGTGVANVTITGGTIGYDGKENGMVFGSSRGDINQPGARDDHCAWVYDTHVTIGASGSETGPQINGTVYGSGENGHVFHDTEVNVHSGTIGIYKSTDAGYTVTSNGKSYSGAEYPYRGNVYGGGCGTDKYYSSTIPAGHTAHDGEGDMYNSLAGIVYGTTTVNITGGTVVRNVYGAGAMGSVGKITTTTTNNVSTTTIPTGGTTTISISGGQVGVDGTNNGNVFGAARGDATTNQTDVALVKNTSVNISATADVKGSVYGGGETGDVQGNTEVNVCAQKQTSGENVTYVVTSGTPTIGGNVYGGGKGVANSFTCAKAMVGIVEQGVTDNGENANPRYTLLDGGTTVRIYNGMVGTLEGAEGSQTLKAGTGNVYGGGEIARVERNTVVEIGAAEGTSTPTIRGNVFAAGAGVVTHGYSALVRGHSTVTVQGQAQVLKNVYGGGELASVGRYKVKISEGNPTDAPADLPSGMPYGLKAGGTSTVIIQGSATIGTVNDALTGHVYGAGQGVEPRNYDYLTKEQFDAISENAGKTYNIDEHQPKRMIGNNTWEHFGSKSAYLQFIETLAISAATDVTIGGGTINGSVFGGSESGFVYRNTDVKIQGGTVKGDAFGGGRGLESFAEAGRVRWNTKLAVSGDAAIEGNVYGGGNLGDVGTIYKDDKDKDGNLTYNYVWKNSDSNGNNLDAGNNNTLGNNTVTDANTNKNTGICTVDISGGTIGLASTNEPTKHGNVFGAGQGSWHTWWCEKAIVYATDVSVSGGTVNGNVYGGGEVGRVEDDAKVTIGTSGETGTEKPKITGSVFGGGAGLQTHGYSALVRGDSKVTVQGASKVTGNVYGGGEIASVGRFKVVGGLPTKPKGGGTCTVVVKDNAVTGDVYGSCKGVTPNYVESGTNRSKSMQLVAYKPAGAEGTTWDYYKDEAGKKDERFIWVYYTKDAYLAFLPTLGLASNTHVTIDGSSAVNGSVFGGGQRGITLGGVDVNINGGTVSQDVYGGGALANSNSSHWHEGQRTEYVELDELLDGSPVTGYYTATSADALITDVNAKANSSATYYAIFKTNVNLKGGTVNRNVYGGGLGQLAKAAVGTPGSEGYVAAEDAIEAKVYGDVLVKLNEPTTSEGNTTYGNCVVKDKIFGCNNLNGSPQSAVTVHIYKTEDHEGHVKDTSKSNSKYNVEAVYGGGNLAAFIPDYKPVADTAVVRVIIDGCDQTSIKTVYGGGNAASVPATEVTVNGTYEIGQVFGGGNGKDDYELDGKWYDNPGANVGLKNYTHSGTGAGTENDPILAINNTDPDTSTRENRETNYGYGIGKTHATIYGGTVHEVYGGSNSRGNVRVESRTTLEDRGCDFTVSEAYGGGSNAPQDGDAVLEIGCISGLGKAYGGAANADVNGDVILNITNGTYGQVFGGNDQGGAIRGTITVNIEETGCRPIIIGELYGGGNLARYSVYGYNDDGSVKETGNNPVADPQVNVHSFTSIGKIFGGGYGASATMVGNPTVNVNVVKGKYRETVVGEGARVIGSKKIEVSETGYDANKGFAIPSHDADAIGSIGSVFGGGNEAKVIGNPNVNIGTEAGDEVYEIVTATLTPGTTSVANYYTLTTPASYTQATGNAVEGTTYYEKKTGDVYQKVTVAVGADVTSYYTLTTPASYAQATGNAVEGTTYYEKKTVGVDIRGDVYGGGNQADVEGDTNVVIGKKVP